MNTPDEPSSQSSSGPPSDEVADLVRSIEERDAGRNGPASASARGGVAPVWYVLLAVAIAGNAYLWIVRPPWVFGETRTTATAPDPDGRLRYRMYVQASRIEAFRRGRGRLPESMAEMDVRMDGLAYRRIGADGWELTGEDGSGGTVSLRSTDSIEAFLRGP